MFKEKFGILFPIALLMAIAIFSLSEFVSWYTSRIAEGDAQAKTEQVSDSSQDTVPVTVKTPEEPVSHDPELTIIEEVEEDPGDMEDETIEEEEVDPLAEFGLSKESSSKDIHKKLRSLLKKFGVNEDEISRLSELSGKKVRTVDVLSVFKVRKDSKIFKKYTVKASDAYSTYIELIKKKEWGTARALNKAVGPIKLIRSDLKMFLADEDADYFFGDEERFCKNILVNYDYSVKNLVSLGMTQDYAQEVHDRTKKFESKKINH